MAKIGILVRQFPNLIPVVHAVLKESDMPSEMFCCSDGALTTGARDEISAIIQKHLKKFVEFNHARWYFQIFDDETNCVVSSTIVNCPSSLAVPMPEFPKSKSS